MYKTKAWMNWEHNKTVYKSRAQVGIKCETFSKLYLLQSRHLQFKYLPILAQDEK